MAKSLLKIKPGLQPEIPCEELASAKPVWRSLGGEGRGGNVVQDSGETRWTSTVILYSFNLSTSFVICEDMTLIPSLVGSFCLSLGCSAKSGATISVAPTSPAVWIHRPLQGLARPAWLSRICVVSQSSVGESPPAQNHPGLCVR